MEELVNQKPQQLSITINIQVFWPVKMTTEKELLTFQRILVPSHSGTSSCRRFMHYNLSKHCC